MQKRLAILLLRIEGAPDKPSRSYADKFFTSAGLGTRNLVEYFDEVSHGAVDLSKSEVFGWMDFGHTIEDLDAERTKAHDTKKKELLDAGSTEADAEEAAAAYGGDVRRDKIVEWAGDAAAANGIVLTSYDGTVAIFNQRTDYFGYPGFTILNWEPAGPPFTIDLTGVAHEVGHNLGLDHSRRDGSDQEYGDKWDIMSAYNVYSEKNGKNKPPVQPYLRYGPGLNAVNMELAGWLDQTRLYTGGATSFLVLRPLHRRDLPGWLAARVQLGNSTIYIEFRLKDRWDKNIPDSCILLHRRSIHPKDGNPCSELLIAHPGPKGGTRPDLRDGESYEAGDAADPFGFYARITVASIDPIAMEAHLEIQIRERRFFEPVGTSYGAVTTDGGGLFWTPGRGFVKVPPRSPLIRVLESLAEYEALQAMDGRQLESLRLERLTSARDQLTRMITGRQSRKVPAPAIQLRKGE
jgi:M6 family metalloprotease-like protein